MNTEYSPATPGRTPFALTLTTSLLLRRQYPDDGHLDSRSMPGLDYYDTLLGNLINIRGKLSRD